MVPSVPCREICLFRRIQMMDIFKSERMTSEYWGYPFNHEAIPHTRRWWGFRGKLILIMITAVAFQMCRCCPWIAGSMRSEIVTSTLLVYLHSHHSACNAQFLPMASSWKLAILSGAELWTFQINWTTTLWKSNMAIEHGPLFSFFPIKNFHS